MVLTGSRVSRDTDMLPELIPPEQTTRRNISDMELADTTTAAPTASKGSPACRLKSQQQPECITLAVSLFFPSELQLQMWKQQSQKQPSHPLQAICFSFPSFTSKHPVGGAIEFAC